MKKYVLVPYRQYVNEGHMRKKSQQTIELESDKIPTSPIKIHTVKENQKQEEQEEPTTSKQISSHRNKKRKSSPIEEHQKSEINEEHKEYRTEHHEQERPSKFWLWN